MSVPFLQVSGDAQRALEQFRLDFLTALSSAAPDAWATLYGLANTSTAIKTTYPLSISAAGYVEAKGDFQMRSMYERSLSMKTKTWTDGIAEYAKVIEAPDFIGWGDEPAKIAIEGARLPNQLVAAVLHANANLGLYADENLNVASTIPLFSDVHPVNIFDTSFGTFDNDHAMTLGTAGVAAMLTRWRQKKGPNGKPAGRRVTHWLVPAALEEPCRTFLSSDLMYNAILASGTNVNQVSNNIYKGFIQLVVCDELLDDTLVYAIDAKGPKPWIVQQAGAPEEIIYDRNSELYKSQFKLGIKYKLEANAAAALPHAIERITLTVP